MCGLTIFGKIWQVGDTRKNLHWQSTKQHATKQTNAWPITIAWARLTRMNSAILTQRMLVWPGAQTSSILSTLGLPLHMVLLFIFVNLFLVALICAILMRITIRITWNFFICKEWDRDSKVTAAIYNARALCLLHCCLWPATLSSQYLQETCAHKAQDRASQFKYFYWN